jgi:hypothetical protein
MKSRELNFLDWFNTQMDLNLKPTKDFDRWDFQDDNYLIELKIRLKYYWQKLLQADKGLSLIQNAEALDKIPLYIVTDHKGVYIYNLNKINLLEYPICEVVAPVTTEFEKDKLITKYCYVLPEADATKILRYGQKS